MKVISIKENKDGSAKVKFDITDEEFEMFRKQAQKKKKKFDKNFIRKEILGALKNAVRNKEI